MTLKKLMRTHRPKANTNPLYIELELVRGLGSRLIHEAGTVTGEARTLGVFLGSSARSARFSDRASRAPLLSGPFDLFFRLAFPSGIFIGTLFYRTRPALQTHPPM